MHRRRTNWMWAEACAALREAVLLQHQLGGPAPLVSSRPAWEPPVDVFEDGTRLVVRVALPGVAPENVQVELGLGYLVVRAERAVRIEPPRARVRQLEIPHGHFERRVVLPRGGYELDELEALHGCVALTLRRR